MVKCLRFRGKREIASLIFAFARGFTWFARGSLIYCVLLNAIVEKTRNSQLLDLAFKKRPTVYHIAGKFGGELNLAVWRSPTAPPNLISAISARKNYVMKFCFAITNRQI